IEKKNEEYSKFNIGIVGPSRIGKTSLIYNIIELSNKILSNNVMIKPDYYTLIDINKYISERNNLLNQSEFVSDVLEATETEKEYNLFIEKNNVKIGFTLYDFRGGLIEEADEKFDKYEKKLKNCNVIIIPTDATLIMEADTNDKKINIQRFLHIDTVQEIMQNWSKTKINSDLPLLVILSPIKCESYLSNEKSNELFNKTLNCYQKTIDIISKELKNKQNIEIFYSPIETLGCVDISCIEWIYDNSNRILSYKQKFKKREPFKVNPKGGDLLLSQISRMLLKIALEKTVENRNENIRDITNKTNEIKDSFWKNLGYNISLDKKKNDASYLYLTDKKNDLETIIGELEKLSNRDFEKNSYYKLFKLEEGQLK
ncbi:MAG TPA: hypothetical protein PLI57_09360, partial [Spirochaetota bacterium]|nr:hypothetical protein [Spirochaetota bacterium]